MLIGMGKSGRLWRQSSSESPHPVPAGGCTIEDGTQGPRADGRELGQTNQCLYCLTQALRIDPSDADALWEVANIHRAQGSGYKVCLRLPQRDRETDGRR
jgi:hypothetical protein